MEAAEAQNWAVEPQENKWFVIPAKKNPIMASSNNFYSSSNIRRMMKSRRLRWAGRVACMERREMHIGF
jgi:hypothetical protein